MSQELTTQSSTLISVDLQEKVFIGGDLSKLKPEERLQYYAKLCESLNLNPLTRPFEYITFQGKMTLYARKDATEQLRKTNKISIDKMESKILNDIYTVQIEGSDATGRKDVSTGAVNIAGLKGDALANAYMKAETKAKRRFTLSISGLGLLDETELETIPELKNINSTVSLISNEKKTNDWLTQINECKSLEQLKHVFNNAKNIYGKSNYIETIIRVKDVKKKELEDQLKTTSLEMFGGVDEGVHNASV